MNTVYFWDTSQLTCIQQYVSYSQLHPEGLVVLKHNIFWCFGKRFTQFDTKTEGDQDDLKLAMKGQEETNYANQVMINDYLLQIFVVKKKEVRMYDIEKGVMTAIHADIFQEDGSEITKFKIDKRFRKAYVANNQGKIIVINC